MCILINNLIKEVVEVNSMTLSISKFDELFLTKYSLYIYIGLFMFDIITTAIGICWIKAVELNPLYYIFGKDLFIIILMIAKMILIVSIMKTNKELIKESKYLTVLYIFNFTIMTLYVFVCIINSYSILHFFEVI